MSAGKSNWMEKFRKNKDAVERLRESAQEKGGGDYEKREQLPNLTFPIDVPMFIKTITGSRVIPKTMYGPREVLDVEILETTDPAQEQGLKCTMWLTQSVLKSKMEQFRHEQADTIDLNGEILLGIPVGLELFVLNHGRRKGAGGFSYYDYTILTAEEGRALIEAL